MIDKIVLLAFSAFLFVGAYMGYIKGSLMSLAMGAGSGLMVLLGLWLMQYNAKGSWLFLGCLSFFLTLTFLLRVLKTQSFLPAGILLLVSLAVAIYCSVRWSNV